MNVDESSGIPHDDDFAGAIEPQHPLERVLDTIARNDKDMGASRGAIQPASKNTAVVAAQPVATPQRLWPGASAAKPAQSPGEMLSSILRYKWTLILVWLLVSAPIIALIWTQIVPKYRARAEVRVRPVIPVVVFKTDENGQIPFYESFVNTQVSLMRSLAVLQRVLDQPEIQQTQWYKGTANTFLGRLMGSPTPPLERLRDGLYVRPRARTEIIDVSFTYASAGEAKLIVNEVLDQYLVYRGESSDAEEDQLYRELVEQASSLESEIQGHEKICAELRRQLKTQTPEELISAKRVYLNEMETRLSELRNTIAILQWEISQIPVSTDATDANDANEVPVIADAPPETKPEYFQDEEWRALDRNINDIKHEIGNSIKGPNHPDIIRLNRDLEYAQGLRNDREAQLDELWLNRAVPVVSAPAPQEPDPNQIALANLRRELARAQREEQLLRSTSVAQQNEFEELFAKAQLLASEMNALSHQRDLYDTVRESLERKSIERNANVPGAIDVLMEAFVPSTPDEDRRVIFTAMALFCGFGLGGGVAFLRASRDKTICGLKDMPQPAQTPFLGQLPVVRTTKPLGKSLCNEIEQNQFMLAESIRVLRTALLSRLKSIDHGDAITVLVTSAGAGTGKSSFTMMLGKSIAQAGKRVLLMDTDFHRTSLSKRLELLDKEGLVDVLAHKSVDDLPIFSTKTPGMDVMPAGRQEGRQYPVFEEIANGAFKSLVRRVRNECNYDIILLDSAPILPVADATILASQVDGTIMVERERVSHRTQVMDAVARLGLAGGRLLGTVYVGSFSQEHYGYGYGYGYGRRNGKKS